MSYHPQSRAGRILQYPFIPLLCLLATGILSQQYLPLQGLFWLLSLTITLLCCITLHLIRGALQSLLLLRRIGFGVLIISLGATLCYYRDVRHAPNWYGSQLKNTDALEVQLTGAPVDKQRTQLLPVKAVRVLRNHHWYKASGQVQLYLYGHDSMPLYRQGTTLLIPNKLTPLRSSGNPFAFEYARYAARNGIFHQAFLSTTDLHLLQQPTTGNTALAQLRSRMLHSIDHNVRDSSTRSLIAATLLNERSSLDDTLWQAYSITGIVHIIAISGMHITILFAILLFLLSWFRYKQYDWLKYLIALPLVWAYIMLTGFPPSAVRAAVAFTLVAIGMCIGKEGNALNTWAATGFLLLCYNPYWLWDVGVQLSFLAVLSILLFYKPIRNWMAPPNKVLQAVWDTFAVSIAAQILVFPLVLYYFHQFPLLGLAASLPAAVYSTLLMIGSILLFVLDACFGSCIWLGSLLGWITTLFHSIILYLAALTPGWIRHLMLSATDYWLMMFVVVCCCIFCFNRRNAYLQAALAGCCLLLSSFIYQDMQALRSRRFLVYNTARLGLADYFTGKSVKAVGVSDTTVLDTKTYNYTLFPARLGFRALAPSKDTITYSCWRIGKTTVVYLQEDIDFATGAAFPVDYLVVSTKCRYRGPAWFSVFHPKMIILDGSLSRSKAQRWMAQLQALKIPVYWVGEDGAWILEERR